MRSTDLSPAGDSLPLSALELALWSEIAIGGEGLMLTDGLGQGEGASRLERFAPAWSELLQRAVEEPGLICDAYSRFHGYSLGNRFGALMQCQLRGIEPGPLNSFNGWRRLGYAVKEGEKALTLCMPLKGTLHREKADASGSEASTKSHDGQPDVEEVQYVRAFVWKPSWFVLSQTVPLDENSAALPVTAPLTWDRDQAFSSLDITPVSFDLLDGNALGFARKRTVAVSPLAPYPFKTLFHEMAHVLLGHTTDNFRGDGNTGLDLSDGPDLSPALIEVEAECVALLCLDTLDLPGQEYCRGYIQHWLREAHLEGGGGIPEKSAQRIFGAADRILAAGAGETRTRAPTAEEVSLSPGGTPLSPAPAAPGEAFAPVPALPVTEEGLPPPPPSPSASDAGQAPVGARSAQTVAMPLTQSLATPDEPTRAAGDGIRTHRPTPLPKGGESDAWQLHAHLQGLYNALHPDTPEALANVDRALRHLYSRDPETTREVRDLVKGVSRGIKSALGRIETLLDGVPESGAMTSNAMSSGISSDNHPESEAQPASPSPTLLSPIEDGERAPVAKADRGDSEAKASPNLSPTRQAAARRGVGRSLKSELEFERARFEKAAKEHELPLGRTHDKEMFQAMSALLGVPIAARRDVSSYQWARCASAIETDDLEWGKSHGAQSPGAESLPLEA